MFDIPSSALALLQIREKLADIADSVIQDKGKVEEFKELLKLKGSPNVGILAVTIPMSQNWSVVSEQVCLLLCRRQTAYV